MGWVRAVNGRAIAVLGASALLLLPATAEAASITVTTTDDVSVTDCTLRDAITAANSDGASGACSAGSGDDVITITATGTINLATQLPILATNVAINGPGASQLEVRRQSAGDFRIFVASDGNFGNAITTSISDLTISNGRLTGTFAAGAGIANLENMTLDRVVVTGNNVVNVAATNSEPSGGGISHGGPGLMTLRRSTVSGNTVTASQTAGSGATSAMASGGGITSSGSLTIERSTISGNTVSASVASADPGASATARGGAIFNFSGLNISVSTISGNQAVATATSPATRSEHGGIRNESQLTATGSTIAFNTGTTSANLSAQLSETVTSTIISDPQGGSSCDGSVDTDGSFNIDEGDTCGIATATDVDPQLGPLADNGGPTRTHKLAASSPAIDQGTAATFTSDQRGQPRPFDMPDVANAADGSDVGAFEFQGSDFPPPPPPPPGPDPDPGPVAGDSSPPDTQISAGPEGKTRKKSATFSFSGTDARAVASFQCKLDDGSFETCSSPKSYTGLKKGTHTFSVRAVDAAGNVDPTPATRTWKVKRKKKK